MELFHPLFFQLAFDQQNADIVDIGAGGACDQQTAAFGEGVVGIVVLQHLGNQNALRRQLFPGLGIAVASGCVGGL